MRPDKYGQMPRVIEGCVTAVEVAVATTFGGQPPDSTRSIWQVGAKEIGGRRARAASTQLIEAEKVWNCACERALGWCVRGHRCTRSHVRASSPLGLPASLDCQRQHVKTRRRRPRGPAQYYTRARVCDLDLLKGIAMLRYPSIPIEANHLY